MVAESPATHARQSVLPVSKAAPWFHSQSPETPLARLQGHPATDAPAMVVETLSLKRHSMFKVSGWREWWRRLGQRMSAAVPVHEIVDAARA